MTHPVKVHARPLGRPWAKEGVGQARAQTLIFGDGDTGNGGLGIPPAQPLTDLEGILTTAGYGVDVSATLPANIKQYKAIWFIGDTALSTSEETELEAFVKAGHGLYLTGENPACQSLDDADGVVVNALLNGGGVQVGGQGYADSASAPNSVNAAAIDDVAVDTNQLTSWTPNVPGGMAGVAPSNVLTSTSFSEQVTPTGAVWDGSNMANGTGRLAILMDINWLETEFWNQSTATQMALNMERFLMSAVPVSTKVNSKWAGYVAKANGVHDATGRWTVPTVECNQVAKASAVGVWVGIDGYGSNELVKAGVGVTCAGPTANPCYYLFTEVLPGTESPTTGCAGVAPGDELSVDVNNSPFGSSTFVVTITDNGSPVGQPITLTAPSKRDKSAECVVELPPGKIGIAPARYKQLADFGTVSFTNCTATATQNAGGTLDTDQLVTGSDGAFTVSALRMGTKKKTMATTGIPTWPDLTWSVSWISAD